MVTWSDKETASKANQILIAVQNSEFNVCLAIVNQLFDYTKPLSIYLQKQNIDLAEAINHIQIIINKLLKIRENVKTVFKDLFQKLQKRCYELDIEIKILRVTKRQKTGVT